MVINIHTLPEKKIRELLNRKKNTSHREDHSNKLQSAAVLIPLLHYDHGWRLLFTHRAEYVNDHKNQVSFPGGSVDSQDQGPIATALREANEEIGLDRDCVNILGFLNNKTTTRNFSISSVVGRIDWPINLEVSMLEVSRVFTIPLDWLANRTNWEIRKYISSNGLITKEVFFQPYDGEILWGVSARITINLLETLEII